jgi:hypothetical protein
MELQELRFKYYGLGLLMKHLMGHIDTPQKMAEYLKLDPAQPLRVSISVTRLVTNHSFVAVQEDLVSTPRGPAIMNIALGQSTAIAHPKKHLPEFAQVQVHGYSTKPVQGEPPVGLPTTAALRTMWREEPLQVHTATINITATQGEGDDVRTASKNMYYGAEFILGTKTE